MRAGVHALTQARVLKGKRAHGMCMNNPAGIGCLCAGVCDGEGGLGGRSAALELLEVLGQQQGLHVAGEHASLRNTCES